MRIAITGSSGLVGRILREGLTEDGHSVMRVVRSRDEAKRGADAIAWKPDEGRMDAAGLEGHDVVVHLAAESLFGVWTPGRKHRIRHSRVHGTQLLASTLAGLTRPPGVLITASAMGYYGDSPGERLTETDPPGDGFLARVVVEWEAATEPAAVAGIRVVPLRFGLVLSPAGGMLGTLAPLFRLGLGGVPGPGDQMWSWIARPDVLRVVRHVIDHEELSGPINVVAPNAVSAEEFCSTLGRVLGRPVPFRVPAGLLKLAPGDMGREVALSSLNVAPQRLEGSGFVFDHPELEPALRTLLDGGGA